MPFTFRPLSAPPCPSLYFAPPTMGLPLPRVTGGMKTREAGQGGGLEAEEAGLFRVVANRFGGGGASDWLKGAFRAGRVEGAPS